MLKTLENYFHRTDIYIGCGLNCTGGTSECAREEKEDIVVGIISREMKRDKKKRKERKRKRVTRVGRLRMAGGKRIGEGRE